MSRIGIAWIGSVGYGHWSSADSTIGGWIPG